jgi:hypothetical protein
MNKSQEIAMEIVKLGDGHDKRVFLEALVWAAASSIWFSVEPEDRKQAVAEFAVQLAETFETIKAGQERKPS